MMSTRLHGSIIVNNSLHSRCGTTSILYPSNIRSPVNTVLTPISIKWSQTSLKSRAGNGSGRSWSFSSPKASSNCEDSLRTEISNISLLSHQHETASAISTTPSTPRPFANFPPDIWGDRFLNYTPEDDDITRAHKEEQIEELKKLARNKLLAAPTTATEGLNLIDNIQRFCLGYHFEKEIEEILQHVHETCDLDSYDNDDLYTVSLRFRLLRQQGLDSSSDVFNKFTDETGIFKESLISDIKGMLSLYEASYYGKSQGDEILDRALAFATTHLSSVAASSSTDTLVRTIVDALKLPLLKNLPMMETRRYIPIYEEDASHDKDLVRLAKLNFNFLQSLHKQELSDLARWYKDLDIPKNFPYIRNRLVEVYFWGPAMRYEPQYQLARKILTKATVLSSVFDDTYDSYGTYEELELLTAAVERWSYDCLDQLPENMKPCFKLLLDTYKEIEEDLAIFNQPCRIEYAIRGMKEFILSYLDEAKWLKEGYTPTMEEYMRSALVTGGYYFMPITFVVGMGDELVTEKVFDWFENDTTIIVDGGVVARLLDDVATHKFEREREHIPSSVEVYMNENNASEKEAEDVLRAQAEKAWKGHTDAMIRKAVPLSLLTVILNLSRSVAVGYLDGYDMYTQGGPRNREVIGLLFIDPVPM